jgi:hypothetical protein
MKKSCLLTLGIVLALVAVTGSVVYLHFKSQFDPVYHGKRIYTWKDQAIWDEDAAAREEAVEVLLEAVEEMEGEPRQQLLLRFVLPRSVDDEKPVLPKELLPFLIRAMKMDCSGYPAKALILTPGPETATALIHVLRSKESSHTRKEAAYVLGALAMEYKLGSAMEQAVAALREASQDEDPEVRKEAADDLNWIEARRKRTTP